MRRFTRRLIAASALSLASGASAAAQDPSIVWSKGSWRVQMLASSTEAFGCQAIKGFASTHDVNRSAAWGIFGTTDGRWGLAMLGVAAERMVGRQVAVTVDEQPLMVSTPRRMKKSGLIFIGEIPSDRMASMVSGRWLTIGTSASSARFHLGGASEALLAAQRCTQAVREAAARSPTPAPHVPPSTPPTANREASSTTPSPRISAGTGFYVSKAGDVITNAHVVQGCSAIGIKGHGDTSVRTVSVRASDTTQDLALLKPDGAYAVAPSTLAWRRDTRLGEQIAIFGFPYLGSLSSSTSGTFTRGDVTALAGLRSNSSHFQLSAPVQPGNSGGPVVDERGHVVGVVVAKLNALGVARSQGDIPQNVNFAIKSAQAISFMEAHGVTVEIGERSAAPLNGPDTAGRLQEASVLVVCAGGSPTR